MTCFLETGLSLTLTNAEGLLNLLEKERGRGGGGVASYLTHFPKVKRGGQFCIFPLKNDRDEIVMNSVLFLRKK